jgi:hypothetical protein
MAPAGRWTEFTVARPALLVAALLSLLASRTSAVAFTSGDFLVLGAFHSGVPTASCGDELCHVDRETGVVTPIAPVAGPAYDSSMVLDGMGNALVSSGGVLQRISLATGEVTTLGPATLGNLVRSGDRFFGTDSFRRIHEVDPVDGSITQLSPQQFSGLAVAPDGALVTSRAVFDPTNPIPGFDLDTELLTFDPDTGSVTPLGDVLDIHLPPDIIAIAPDGSRYVYTGTGWFSDGDVERTPGSPLGYRRYPGVSDVRSVSLAIDVDGNLLLGIAPDFLEDLELLKIDVETGAQTWTDFDFAITALLVVPEPSTALLFALGLLGLARARRA